jgi:hypothetical protein
MKRITTTDGTEVLAFQGGWCPLSLWHWTPINIYGQRYFSAYQYILCEKARHFGDIESYNAIKMCRNTLEQSKLSRGIMNVKEDEWRSNDERVMKVAINEKLAQHPWIHNLLNATGEAVLAHCSCYDNRWGTGFDIDCVDMKNRSRWGKNIVGEILMDFRKNGYDTFY